MNFSLTITGGNEGADIKITNRRTEGGIFFADLMLSLATPAVPEKITLSWFMPATDIYSTFSPSVRHNRQIGPDWRKQSSPSRLASWMPLHSLLSADGTNRLTVALSDALNPTAIATGVSEEDAAIHCKIELFTLPIAPISKYSVTLRLDIRPLPFYKVIRDTTDWWEKECGYTPAPVPAHARLPMNSLWYSYHQNLDPEDILKECALSKSLGMDTVIIDDGWQTEDNHRGYAYCGDWELATSKIPDMADLVRRIHDTGMKVMVWYSVPFVGIYARSYERFKDMLLDESGNKRNYRSLDPRYKEVRDYLVNIYTTAVREWDLDGLKLDFIDKFMLQAASLLSDPRRDYSSLEDAVDVLMSEVCDALRAIKPDILIEFRQTYVGPAIRKYGNMLRVGDCPNDALINRQDVLNLRLTSGHTAVHSDMLMWHPEEKAEDAAMQLTAVLYSVPQISVKIQNLPEQHRRMLAFYLKFWREHREVLLDGELSVYHPESNYSAAVARKDGTAIFTAYTDPVIPCDRDRTVIAVNATGGTELIVRNATGASFKALNCMGDTLSEGTVQNDLAALSVPKSGMVVISR